LPLRRRHRSSSERRCDEGFVRGKEKWKEKKYGINQVEMNE
jgi:hypothetical protein